MKKIALFILSIPLFMAVERFCHRQTDGFALVNIQSPLIYDERWAVDNNCNLADLVTGPFHYLSCGAQSYVFKSCDDRYVLKFFKHQHMRIPPWIEPLWLPRPIDRVRTRKLEKKQKVRDQAFESLSIAFKELKEETGLCYLHLNKTSDLDQVVTLVDKLGIPHEISLDEYEFVIQKKGELAYDYLKDHQGVEPLKELVHLAVNRCKKGINDKDPDFATNFGFIQGRPIQIDTGRFSYRGNVEIEAVFSEMIRITRPLKAWLESFDSKRADRLDQIIYEAVYD